MNIHEYQAKQMLSRFGVRVPKGRSAFTPPEARAVAQVLGGDSWVVKAQIHAGGRGAGHFADNPGGREECALPTVCQRLRNKPKQCWGMCS